MYKRQIFPNLTPIGAKITVNGAIRNKAGKLTRPTWPISASFGVSTKKKAIKAPGKAINNPKHAAVPTALCVAKFNELKMGTPKVPPPIPIITERNPITDAMIVCMKELGNCLKVNVKEFLKIIFILTKQAMMPNKNIINLASICVENKLPSTAKKNIKGVH